MNAAINRRAVLGTVLATAVSPAVAASEPQLSADDRAVLTLYLQRIELKAIVDQVSAEYSAGYDNMPQWARGPTFDNCRDEAEAEYERRGLDALGRRSDAVSNALTDLEAKINKYLGKSIFALAVGLTVQIRDDGKQDIHDLLREALAAIRPQLVGAIAEAGDRVLAQKEEEYV
jgi:hypothetical protein